MPGERSRVPSHSHNPETEKRHTSVSQLLSSRQDTETTWCHLDMKREGMRLSWASTCGSAFSFSNMAPYVENTRQSKILHQRYKTLQSMHNREVIFNLYASHGNTEQAQRTCLYMQTSTQVHPKVQSNMWKPEIVARAFVWLRFRIRVVGDWEQARAFHSKIS